MGLPLMFLFTKLALGLAALYLYAYINYDVTNELQIKTSRGWVEGGYTKTRGGRKVMQFLGIPYAKSPVNELSFKDPVEPDLWQGVRNATVECSMCMQQYVMLEELRDKVIGDQDCLCVNVFTPNATTSSKLPVIFFIHGGFYLGSSMAKSLYGPEMLLDKDVVLVTANYRVGVLGFLTTEDSVIPGNWGLKDQAAALRWVKDNIQQFGGDPDSITLMGQGSGAGSVHLHMLSPLTKDLFHRGIIQSGSGLCLWGFSEPGVLKKRSQEVAKLIGCPFVPSTEFLKCLQETDGKKIVDTTKHFVVWDIDPIAFWNPVVESADVKGAFLVQSPYKLTSTKPLLAGYNFAEGMLKVSSLISGNHNTIDAKFRQWNGDFFGITAKSLLYDTKAQIPRITTKLMMKYYYEGYASNLYMSTNKIPRMIMMFGDFWFTNGLLDAVEKHSGPKYLYHFNYDTTVSVCSTMYNTTAYGYKGACHSDELMYLFPMEVKVDNFINTESPDYKLSLKMVELWTNFAANSVPMASGITWDPVKTSNMEQLQITNKGFTIDTDPLGESRDFWKNLGLGRK